MRTHTAVALVALAIGGCTTNTAVPTTESWVEVTPEQAVAPVPERIDAHANPIERPPTAGRDGCALNGTMPGDEEVMIIRDAHPREKYCVRVAPLRMTTIELPAGVQMTSAQTAMMDFLSITSAEAGGRTTIAVQAKCVPLREENGQIQESRLHRFLDQGSLPFCPRHTGDLAVTTTAGPLYFQVYFNEFTRTRVVDIRDEPIRGPEKPKIPTKTTIAQDLYATSVDGQMVPWVPDDAWADGSQTVVAWHRPMGTLPGLHIGQTGEQVGTPTVIHDDRALAMVYPRRLTEFELRMGDRRLRFSAEAPGSKRVRRANHHVGDGWRD